MATVLDPEKSWNAIYNEAKRALRTGRIYHSPIQGQRYRVIEVIENKLINVERVDANKPSDVGKGQVLSCIERLNDNNGVCPREIFHTTVAKQATIVNLHPQLTYDASKQNIIVGLKKEQENLKSELERRFEIWDEVKNIGSETLSAKAVRKLDIYGGQAGIYRSLSKTANIADNEVGIAVGLRHTGRDYPDDLTDEVIRYHYPHTKRSGDHDRNEVEATKNCMRYRLPVFVILEEGRNRNVKLGWVTDFDDSNEVFLVEFAEQIDSTIDIEEELEIPFKMKDKGSTKKVTIESTVRKNQKLFRHKCLKRYHAKCAVCDVSEESPLDAAHIYPKEEDGSDHVENGLILCATHHRAFDGYLFGINPDTMDIVVSVSTKEGKLQITKKNLNHLENPPHQKPLNWKWKQFLKKERKKK